MRWVVIVNGPPGSGKTTLARALSKQLRLPLFSKDAVKETLLDTLGFADRADSGRLGAASGEVLWSLLAGCPAPAIIESWLAPSTRSIVQSGLARAEVDRVIEVWCSCPPEETRRRYESRQRHPGHFQDDYLDVFDQVVASAEPLGVGKVINVGTAEPVDFHVLAALIEDAVRS